MPRKLSAGEARATFEELVKELPKQHLRLQFRKRFGTGELLDPKMLKKAAVVAPREKPVSNLLQEVPAQVLCRRLVGNAEEIRGDEWETKPDAQIGHLFSPEEVEQGLVVQGRRARLFVYADPTEATVYVLRVATEVFGEEEPKPKAPPPKLSRRQAARKAGKTKGGGAPRGRGRR
jgi:hypothetical protein